jgi:hypothetical protein
MPFNSTARYIELVAVAKAAKLSFVSVATPKLRGK